MILVVPAEDPALLGVLSSRIHVVWSLGIGGTLEDRPRYNKSVCFDPFPFPDPTDAQRARIAELAEQLDAHRKRQQAAHPGLTLTGMYNVLAALREGRALTAKEKAIHDQALVGILRQLHDDLDVAVAAAYGWPADLDDDALLTRLVDLNRERAAEEAAGRVRWLRPDLQAPVAAKPAAGRRQRAAAVAAPAAGRARPPWPKPLRERVAAVRGQLGAQPLTATELAGRFARGSAAEVVDILATLDALGMATRRGEAWTR